MRLINADAIATQLRQRSQNLKGTYGDLGGACSGVARLIEEVPTVDAVPVKYIEKKIEWLVGLDNAFSGLAASSLRAMLASWRKESGDETD